MKKLMKEVVILLTICVTAAYGQNDIQKSPIVKLGTIDAGQGETSPMVFKGNLYRLEAIHKEYHSNKLDGKMYLQVVDVATGQPGAPFALGHALSSAYAEGDKVYVFGTPGWGASTINMFVTTDLVHWKKHEVLNLPGWTLFNTSVCKAGKRYVMAFEVGAPAHVTGVRFTSRFAESTNLTDWTVLPDPAVHTKAKYSACPTIRWIKGWFYMSYLNNMGGNRYETNIVRSKDLAKWEESSRNPVVTFDEGDKRIASDRLTPAEIARIRSFPHNNASDIDYIEFEGQVVIYYSWGDQTRAGFLSKAIYSGTMEEFFGYYFP